VVCCRLIHGRNFERFAIDIEIFIEPGGKGGNWSMITSFLRIPDHIISGLMDRYFFHVKGMTTAKKIGISRLMT